MGRSIVGDLASPIREGLFLAALFLNIGPAAIAEPDVRGTLSGTVLDPDGAPIEGARVWVNTTDRDAMAVAQTGRDGRFRLGPLRPVYRNPFDLLVDASGFARQYVARGSYSVYPGIDADLGTIQVEKGGVFSGRILDADGTPCPNTPITCELSRNISGERVTWNGPALLSVSTDAAGRFRTPPLAIADGYLYVHVPGRREGAWRRSVEPGVVRVLKTLRLEPEVPVPGVVRDEQGRPIAGVTLTLNSRYVETSDVAGRFTLHGQGPDLYAFLDGTRDGYADLHWHVQKVDGGLRWNDYRRGGRSGFEAGKELAVVMEPRARTDRGGPGPSRPTRRLTGRVTRDGRPVAVGWVALWSAPGLAGLLRGRTVVVPPSVSACDVIRDGVYHLEVLSASNNWYVVVEEPGQPPTQVGPVAIEGEDKMTIDIVCNAGGGIRGRVTGVPPDWAGHLWVVAFTETSLRAEAKVDAEGRFSFAKLAPGEYGLKVGHDAFEDSDVPRDFPPLPLWTADPWTRARKVVVAPGREVEGVELALPE